MCVCGFRVFTQRRGPPKGLLGQLSPRWGGSEGGSEQQIGAGEARARVQG